MGRTAHCLSTFLPSFCFHRRASQNDWFQTPPSQVWWYVCWLGSSESQWSSTNFGKHYVFRVHCRIYDNVSVFTIKAFQWLRRWVLLPKCPDWHQDNSIAPMLRPKLLERISKEMCQFLYLIIIIIKWLEEQFLPLAKAATSLLGLIPSVLCSLFKCM